VEVAAFSGPRNGAVPKGPIRARWLQLSSVMNAKIAALVSVALLLASASACKRKDKGGGGSSWIVGQHGTMVRFDAADGHVSDYSLESDADLYDIACRGEEWAWVVGAQGTMLRTGDGGETWEAVDVGSTEDLRAVAAAGADIVYAAGDGPLLVSDDSGASWREVPGSTQTWTDVATGYDGRVALGVTAGGDIFMYRTDWGSAERVHSAGAGLNGVSMTADGSQAIAVGDDGLVLYSLDRGWSWTARPDAAGLPTLRRVQLAHAGKLAVALGDAGTIARIGADLDAVQLLDDGQALRSVHVSASGRAVAVGDGGVAFVSDDAGVTWAAVDLGVDATLFGVDDLHGEPHL